MEPNWFRFRSCLAPVFRRQCHVSGRSALWWPWSDAGGWRAAGLGRRTRRRGVCRPGRVPLGGWWRRWWRRIAGVGDGWRWTEPESVERRWVEDRTRRKRRLETQLTLAARHRRRRSCSHLHNITKVCIKIALLVLHPGSFLAAAVRRG